MGRARSGNMYVWMALVSLCIMYAVFTGIVFNTITLYMGPVLKDFPNLTRAGFMLIITIAGALNAVISMFFFGPLQARFGLRKLLGTGAAAIVIGLGLFASMSGPVAMYAGAVMFGIGISFESTISVSVGVNTWFKKNIGTLIGICTTFGAVVGIIFAPIVGSWIMNMGWRQSFWVTLVITAIFSVIMVLLYHDSPEKVGARAMWADEVEAQAQAAPTGGPAQFSVGDMGIAYSEMFKTSQFYLLAISYFLIGVLGYSVMGNMAIFTADLGFNDVVAGTVLSVIFLVNAVCMIPGGTICDKAGSRYFMLIAFTALIAALLIMRQDHISMLLLYVVASLVGVTYVAVNVPLAVSVKEAFGEKDYGKKMGVCAAFMLAGVALGNPILQLFYDTTGSYKSGFLIYIVLCILVIIMMFPATKRASSNS